MDKEEMRLELIKVLTQRAGLQVNQVVDVAKEYESYIMGDNSDKEQEELPSDKAKVSAPVLELNSPDDAAKEQRKGSRKKPRKSPE